MGNVKGSVTETTETPDGSLTGSSGQVETPYELTEAVPQAEVTYGAGFTEPTKPYGNVKVFVQLKITVDVGEQDDGFTFCEDWVDTRLGQKMTEIKEQFPD